MSGHDGRLAGRVALAVLFVLAASGCPKGPATSEQPTGPQRADDSADALVGTYTNVTSFQAVGGCDGRREGGIGDGGTLSIQRGGDGGNTEGSPDALKPQLLFQLCAAQAPCSEPIWKGRLDKGEVFGWEDASGDARLVDGPPMARRCRLEWRRVALVPDERGLELERIRRRGVVTLEGDGSCSAETAREHSDQLPCAEREWLRVEPKAN